MIPLFVCCASTAGRLLYVRIYMARMIPGIFLRWGGATFVLAMVIEWYRLAPLKRRNGAHRVFSNKADIAFTKRKSQWDVRWTAWWMGPVLLITTLEADFGMLCAPSCVQLLFSNFFIRLVLWPLLPGNGIPCICLVDDSPCAYDVIPTPLRRATDVRAELDETRFPSRLPRK